MHRNYVHTMVTMQISDNGSKLHIVTGFAKTGHICANNTSNYLENGTFLGHFL